MIVRYMVASAFVQSTHPIGLKVSSRLRGQSAVEPNSNPKYRRLWYLPFSANCKTSAHLWGEICPRISIFHNETSYFRKVRHKETLVYPLFLSKPVTIFRNVSSKMQYILHHFYRDFRSENVFIYWFTTKGNQHQYKHFPTSKEWYRLKFTKYSSIIM